MTRQRRGHTGERRAAGLQVASSLATRCRLLAPRETGGHAMQLYGAAGTPPGARLPKTLAGPAMPWLPPPPPRLLLPLLPPLLDVVVLPAGRAMRDLPLAPLTAPLAAPLAAPHCGPGLAVGCAWVPVA